MNRLMRYSGSKIKYIEQLNNIASKSRKKNYVELFCGSGALLFNLEDRYKSYTLNDMDSNLINIYTSLQQSNYEDYIFCRDSILRCFGDIKKSKESYYNFRNSFNDKFYKKTEGIEYIKRGRYLYFLYNSCINSFARFGPNGFNQSYGARSYFFDEESFNNLKQVIDSCTILNLNYKDVGIKDSLVFLDPPYIESKTSYTHNNIDINEFVEYCNILEENNNDIIITNIYSDILTKLLNKYNIEEIRTMRNTSPNRSSEYTDKEMIYWKIK